MPEPTALLSSLRSHEDEVLRKLLHAIRKEADLSQKELAALLGADQTYVSKVEKGERGPISLARALRWAKHCKVGYKPFLMRLAVALEK